MKDIKELIFAAVEENAVKFQELVNAQLQTRAYEAIEALRPEVAASMFGEEKESKKKGNESCDDMDDEDDSGEMDEELKGNQHKIDKNKNGKIDAHDFKLLRKEELEQIDELSTDKLSAYAKAANASRATLNKKWTQGEASWRDKEKVINREKGEDRAHKIMDRRAVIDKEMKEEAVNEVAHPQNAADWQALIAHQIKVTGHPVATDAQFRATHGKDESKIASLEPGQDKAHYAAAQGGQVKA